MSEKPRRDPKFKNIVWDEPEPGQTTAVFLGPEAARALKRSRDAAELSAQDRKPPQDPERKE